jgi:glycosyltransferase involved in cell wall biosynthesis
VQRRIAEGGLAAQVAQVGRVEAVGPYLHAIDVLVVPSVADESLPLVVLEAMAAGTPVVASDLSGIPEAVQDSVTGRLFRPGDAAALAAVLGELDADRDVLARLGASARSVWAERFSVTAMAAGCLALFERLTRSR